jgi:hypothetical protein
MKKSKPTSIVTEFLFTSAQGFLENAINLAQLAKQQTSMAGVFYLAPATVNFSFAIELLLKSVIFNTTGNSAHGHDLSILFTQIPPNIQEAIRKAYLNYRLTQTTELGNYKAMGSDTEAANVAKKIETATVEDLLITHRGSFEKWRYAYEMSDQEYFCIDFDALLTFAKALTGGYNSFAATSKQNSV